MVLLMRATFSVGKALPASAIAANPGKIGCQADETGCAGQVSPP
jgi:hypothetical protein